MITTTTLVQARVQAGSFGRERSGSRVWNRAVVDALDAPRLAHAPEWFTIIRTAYGHEPLYLTAEDGEGRLGVLPAFLVRRPLFGAVVTSMPFLDSGGPCSGSPDLDAALVEGLLREAQRLGASTVDLRCANRLELAVQPREHKVNLTLPLSADPDRLWAKVDAATRNKVRKAQRSGLTVEHGSHEHLEAFHDVFVARMRDLGSPVHALGFFRAIVDAFGARARIVLVRKGAAPVGGLLALTFRDRMIVPWSACATEYLSLGPNVLLYWETLRRACLEGFARFDFGRSTRGSGTYRFKRQWGAGEEPLFWYTIPTGTRRELDASRAGRAADIVTAAWQRLPLCVTRLAGPRIRKYLIQ